MSLYNSLRKLIYPYKIVLKHIPFEAIILDIGCGDSHIMDDNNKINFNSYTGIDPKIKKEFLNNNIKILRQTIEENLEKINLFNCVIMIDVMHHIHKNQQEIIINTILRKLSPGTIFIYKDISTRNKFLGVMNFLHDLLYNFNIINYYNSKKIIKIISNNKSFSYKHFYKRILWFDHEFLIIKKK
jgi:2-polyprenyl-3-methyl-5-hydroxy-6-metoxy-1,4-benzoquinol methylase